MSSVLRYTLHVVVIAIFAFQAIDLSVSFTEDTHPIVGVSVNIVDLLWQYINTSTGGRPAAIKAMQDASSRSFVFYRFAASAYWPNELRLWFNTTTRTKYWQAFDELVGDAEKIGARLVPSIAWNQFAFCDVCKEPLQAYFNETSCTQQAIKRFTEDLVSRYCNSSVILFWELGNEFNLLADLDMEGKHTSIAPSKGTPKIRTKADNVSTDQMIGLYYKWTSWIRAIDPHRLISSGHAVPRASAQHLRRSYYMPQRDWTNDSREEFEKNLIDVNRPCDIMSVHLYSIYGDNLRFNISTDKHNADLLRIIKQTADRAGKILYLGEFGDPLPGDRLFTRNALRVIVEAFIEVSTVWVWEFYQTSATVPANFSLIPGRDDGIIKCMQSTNVDLKNHSTKWSCD
ncbi:uncharacterized protein LOC134178888 [Corticium candelabrum]|uniref:uncharacterized protein LOC134178888 n=1 Tax=Corticium candelabrum TaxID=121492 RepID=UPI002E25BB2F|nr:uncharacterized protein LOC134178888 [Corticium candelabrum]